MKVLLTSVPPDVNTMSIVNEEKGRKGISKCWEREREGVTQTYDTTQKADWHCSLIPMIPMLVWGWYHY